MVSAVEQAKRALVSLLKLLATAYKCVLDVTRDSSDQEVKSAYRKLSKRTHPDKGFWAKLLTRLEFVQSSERRRLRRSLQDFPHSCIVHVRK